MRFVWPPDGFFVERDLPKLQHVPLLLDAGSFPLEANRYVIERCLGEWAPDMDEDDDPTVLTLKSRANLATRLCAFFFWLDQKDQRDWRRLDYSDLLGYQLGLQLGTANASARPLKEASVNAYVDEACGFLNWAAVRGLRGRFKVPRRRKRIASASRGAHAHSHKGRVVSTRQGALQVHDFEPDILPTAAKIERWMGVMRKRHPIKALEFELMVRTGCRISEAHHLRLACFPRRENQWTDPWRKQGWVPVLLRYGVKGPKVSPSSDLSTRSRTIQVPIDLAERIEHYLSFVRPNLLARYHRGGRKDEARTDRLWLGESTYQPVAYSTLYKAWTTCPHCPDHWHPHAARHYFSVEQIVESTRNFLALNGLQEGLAGSGVGWLHGLMAGQVRLILSPLLGHVDDKTSERYLRAARARLLGEFGHPLIRWNQIIDADLEEPSHG